MKKLEELQKMPPRSIKECESNSLIFKTKTLKEELQKNCSTLRCNLKQLGYTPGPITPTTYGVYLKKLEELRKSSSGNNQRQNNLDKVSKIPSKVNQNQSQNNSLEKKREAVALNLHCGLNNLQDNLEQLRLREKSTSKPTKKLTSSITSVTSKTVQSNRKVYSAELQTAIQEPDWIKKYDYIQLEKKLIDEYINIPARELRGGSTKSFYTYLLLDPRITLNLSLRASTMKITDRLKIFIDSIFYVGKGKDSRMCVHLSDAVKVWNTQESTKKLPGKIQQIIDIWKAGKGIICLRIFENILSEEAHTREATMIQAIGVENLQNLKNGEYYGIVKKWDMKDKCLLGVYLLYKAMLTFLNQEEDQLMRYADKNIKKLLS